ncbi:hypothetical protein B0H19DRAFT_1076744 [Mycena capillaripes]|nr:hypothetical protein B0H19DRAFT_1076744 [Mycena capillaripes]
MSEGVRILNDRPSSEEGVASAALLYPPFGRLIDIFNGADDVTEIDEDALRARVEEFSTAGRKYYSDKFARRTAMLPILNEIFDTHVEGKLWPRILESTLGSLNRVGTGGHSEGELGATDVMTEWKNEMLGITSDAEYEGVAYVTQSHAEATSKYPDVYAANRMPVLLITIQGSHIGFLAILILHRPRVVELTPILGLRHDGTDVSALDILCRAFRAACILRAEIRKDMATMVQQSRTRPPLLHPEFPSIDMCQSYPTGNQHISIKLVDRFESLDDRLLFTAQTSSTLFNYALHTFCYNLGHAPQLLGFQQLSGGWFVVVMELLEGWMHLYSLQLSDPQRFAAYAQIRTLADKFHKEGFVHGDLRTANILAPPGWDSTPTLPRLSVIDYDWGGYVGLHGTLLRG